MSWTSTLAGLATAVLLAPSGDARTPLPSAPTAIVPLYSEASAATSAPAAKPFISADFNVPTLVETPTFKLVPLGPDLVKVDYDAYMSSIEHLQQTFTRSTDWPHKGITAEDAMRDMLTEQARFNSRTSFAYAVLTPDGARERGCVYVYPSPVPGYDAMVSMWVTKAEFDRGFDARLFEWVARWIKQDWPFARVAYPGRTIGWQQWDALVAVHQTKPS